MADIITEYDGFKIVYLKYQNQWKILDDGEHGEKIRDTLADCETLIDGIRKREQSKNRKFPKTVCLHDGWSGLKKITVTNYAGIDRYSSNPTYWITAADGKRSKERNIMKYDEAKYNRYLELNKQKEDLEGQIKAVVDSLEPFTYTGEEE